MLTAPGHVGPPISFLYLHFHNCIRAELDSLATSIKQLEAAQEAGEVHERLLLLKERYGFLEQIYLYHSSVEDEVVYPALDSKVKNVTVAYSVEHRDEELLFEQLSQLLVTALACHGTQRADTIRKLMCKVEEIHTTLRKHLAKEEEQLLPLLVAHFSYDEQAELVAQFLYSIPLVTVERVLTWLKPTVPEEEQEQLLRQIRSVVPDSLLLQLLSDWLQPVTIPMHGERGGSGGGTAGNSSNSSTSSEAVVLAVEGEGAEQAGTSAPTLTTTPVGAAPAGEAEPGAANQRQQRGGTAAVGLRAAAPGQPLRYVPPGRLDCCGDPSTCPFSVPAPATPKPTTSSQPSHTPFKQAHAAAAGRLSVRQCPASSPSPSPEPGAGSPDAAATVAACLAVPSRPPLKDIAHIHRSICSALEAFAKEARLLQRGGDVSSCQLSALVERHRFLRSVCLFHSASEEAVMYPEVRRVSPEHEAALRASHASSHDHDEVALMEELGRLLADVRAFARRGRKEVSQMLDKLCLVSERLAVSIAAHMGAEERDLFPLLERNLCPAQQRSLLWRTLQSMPLRLLERVMPWIVAGLSDTAAAELLTNIRLGAPSEDSVLVQLLCHWADRGRARVGAGAGAGAGVGAGTGAGAGAGAAVHPLPLQAAGAGPEAASAFAEARQGPAADSGAGAGLQAPSGLVESTTELRMLRQPSGSQVHAREEPSSPRCPKRQRMEGAGDDPCTTGPFHHAHLQGGHMHEHHGSGGALAGFGGVHGQGVGPPGSEALARRSRSFSAELGPGGCSPQGTGSNMAAGTAAAGCAAGAGAGAGALGPGGQGHAYVHRHAALHSRMHVETHLNPHFNHHDLDHHHHHHHQPPEPHSHGGHAVVMGEHTTLRRVSSSGGIAHVSGFSPGPGSTTGSGTGPPMGSGFNPIDHIFQFHKALRLELKELEQDAERVQEAILAACSDAGAGQEQGQQGHGQQQGQQGHGQAHGSMEAAGAQHAGGQGRGQGSSGAEATAAVGCDSGHGHKHQAAEMGASGRPKAAAGAGAGAGTEAGAPTSTAGAGVSSPASGRAQPQQPQQQPQQQPDGAGSEAAAGPSGMPKSCVSAIQQLGGRFQFLWGIYRAHSRSEDEIVFPALESKHALRNVSHAYTLDHRQEEQLFIDLDQLLGSLKVCPDPCAARSLTFEVRRMCAAIRASLETHVRSEESELWPLFAEHFTTEEQQYLVGVIIGRTGAQVLHTLLPWISDSFSHEEKEEMMESLRLVTKNTMFDQWLGAVRAGSSGGDRDELGPGGSAAGAGGPMMGEGGVVQDLKPLIDVAEYLAGTGAVGQGAGAGAGSAAHVIAAPTPVSAAAGAGLVDRAGAATPPLTASAGLALSPRRVRSGINATPGTPGPSTAAGAGAGPGLDATTFRPGWEDIFRMNQKQLEAAIHRVSNDANLEPERKAYLIQYIMVSRYIVAQQKRMREAEQCCCTTNGQGQDGTGAPGLSMAGVGPDSAMLSACTATAAMAATAAVTRTFHGVGVLGCQHYRRKCQLVAPCCDKAFTCRLCHDEASSHRMDRYRVRNMVCMECGLRQPVAQSCSACATTMAHYYCDICHLFDDDPTHDIYHCPFCNVCRRGKGLGVDFFHCMTCNACMSLSLFSTHVCREKVMEGDCPVCSESLFDSSQPVKELPCGHFLHSSCFAAYSRYNYTCPLCNKSMGDMTVYFQMLDSLLASERLPAEYAGRTQMILCNDCGKSGFAPFHFVYHSCPHCRSYNTRVTAH